jgi:hypothetical protein
MIPPFTDDGYLPEGVHQATREEFAMRFAIFARSDCRFKIFHEMEKLMDEAAKSRIVKRIIVAGSFVTSRPEPNDFDCILVLDNSIIGRNLRPFEYNLVSRKAARRIFGGDVFPVFDGSNALHESLEFFQTARNGRRVGVVEVGL